MSGCSMVTRRSDMDALVAISDSCGLTKRRNGDVDVAQQECPCHSITTRGRFSKSFGLFYIIALSIGVLTTPLAVQQGQFRDGATDHRR